MNLGLWFLLWMGGWCLLVVTAICFDRVAVFVLGAINAPFYEDARRVAGMIYAHPDQWSIGHDTLKHATLMIRWTTTASILRIEGGAFGEWHPSWVERRILYNACRWHQRNAIRHALGG
jgi:hypothetical protein